MSCFVLNEWLLHDLQGDSGTGARDESILFLERLRSSADCIAVMVGSPWERKAYGLMSRTDRITRTASKLLHLSILLDLDHCVRIGEPKTVFDSPEWRSLIPSDDRHLFDTYLLAGAVALVTTDTTLIDLAKNPDLAGIIVRHRDEFLKEYLALS
ncbi:MAG: hypothetical protein AB1792_03855 [Candidatus Zixiibacteriota bacterium]